MRARPTNTTLAVHPRSGIHGKVRQRLALVASVLAWQSCKPPLCDSELKENTSYVVHIDEVYAQGSRAYFDARYALKGVDGWPSCDGFDGLVPGASMRLRSGDGNFMNGCGTLSWGSVDGIPSGESWRKTHGPTGEGGWFTSPVTNAMGFVGELVSGPCPGAYSVVIGRKGESLFSPPTAGGGFSAVLGRSYYPVMADGAVVAGCSKCADTFVVWLSVDR